MKTISQRTFFILLVSLFSFSVFASNGNPGKKGEVVKLTGKIVDKNTGEALTGVKIFVEGSDKVAYSDFDGEFVFEYVPGENTEISISFVSYENQKIKLDNSDSYTIELNRIK